ncbi:hypothetical protein QLL95_gp0430 [Cotonvirus japonicus]|uniref:Nudix hydrolase domain-containing protein n=1 Tax=Cotonvirus japonicus TaxID=2811091 RepID=A0ABM7NU37_9VIRU|nr:hypothetical protein QLL95_gp0430 [Cotonvirus japonicus]BCS83693.1 hypothetical protein [Cotonvirus japonicus]
MLETTNDAFGNTFLRIVSTTTDTNLLYEEIENIKNPNKGLIFVGFPLDIISELNQKYYNNDIIYLTNKNDETYHLMINNSNCPQFCDETIKASGVSIVVYHENSYYAIIVKDKTKRILTCIGGCCSQLDYKSKPNYSVRTAIKELREETQGRISINNINTHCDGLSLSDSDKLDLLAEMELESIYYGLKVLDTYSCYGLYVDINESDNIFFKFLFDPQNQTIEGNFKMNYSDNTETEYIYAIKLSDDTIFEMDDFKNIMNKISDQISKINLNNARISGLHMFFNYIHLKKLTSKTHNEKYVQDKRELFTELKMLPSLRKLVYFY